MRKWIQSNWVSDADGKRQVVLAGLMLALLLVGVSGAAWCTWRSPLRYRAVLEGEDKRGHYFTTLAVASPNRWQARTVVLGAAKRHGFHIVRVAELEVMGPAPRPGSPRVLKAPWDKTYYVDDDEHEH
jgi:hypothetical protein